MNDPDDVTGKKRSRGKPRDQACVQVSAGLSDRTWIPVQRVVNLDGLRTLVAVFRILGSFLWLGTEQVFG